MKSIDGTGRRAAPSSVTAKCWTLSAPPGRELFGPRCASIAVTFWKTLAPLPLKPKLTTTPWVGSVVDLRVGDVVAGQERRRRAARSRRWGPATSGALVACTSTVPGLTYTSRAPAGSLTLLLRDVGVQEADRRRLGRRSGRDHRLASCRRRSSSSAPWSASMHASWYERPWAASRPRITASYSVSRSPRGVPGRRRVAGDGGVVRARRPCRWARSRSPPSRRSRAGRSTPTTFSASRGVLDVGQLRRRSRCAVGVIVGSLTPSVLTARAHDVDRVR